MDLVLSAVALLILLIGGFGATLLLTPNEHGRGAMEVLSLAVLFGTVLVAGMLFGFGWFISGTVLHLAVTACCLAIGGAGVLTRRCCAVAVLRHVASGTAPAFPVALLTIQVAVVVWLALSRTMGWDGLVVWEFKARLACLHGGVIPLSYFTDPTRQWSHPDYPLLLPLVEAWLYGWLNHCDQGIAKLVFPLFYIAAVGLLYTAGVKLSSYRWKGFLTGILLFFVPAAIIGEGSVSSGYADFPLAVFYLASVVYLLEYWQHGAPDSIRMSGLLSAALPLIKSEGVILWACVAILSTVESIRRLNIWSIYQLIFFMFLPGALLFGAWRLFLDAVDAYQFKDFLPFTLGTLLSNLDRIADIARGIGSEIINWKRWSILWPTLFFSLAAAQLDHGREKRIALPLATLLPLIIYSFIYYYSRWSPITTHISSSLPRLMLHVALVAVLAIGVTFSAPRGWSKERYY